MTPVPYLAAILMFGLFGSFTDIKKGVIRNKMIAAMIGIKIIIDISCFFLGLAEPNEIFLTYVNFVAALSLAMLFWGLGVWSPGDAKFFAAIIALIPFGAYSGKWLILFSILPFVLLPALIIITITAFSKSTLEQKKAAAIKVFSFERIISSTLIIFWLSWTIKIIEGILLIKANPIIYMIAFLLVNIGFDRYLKKEKIYISSFLSIARLLFDYQTIIAVDFWIGFLTSVIFFIIILSAINILGEIYFIPKIKKIDSIIMGMRIFENFRIIRRVNTGAFKVQRIKNEYGRKFLNPRYVFRDNIGFFQEVVSIRKTKFFPEDDASYLFNKKDRELTLERKNLLKKMNVKKVITEDSTVFGPYIFVGTMIFIIVRMFF